MRRFEIPPFRPSRTCRGGHAQTIAGFLFPGQEYPYRAANYLIQLDDGDQIVLHDDCPPVWKAGDRAALLIHGLAGCHQSSYMQRITAKLGALGVRVFRLDMRGCGASFGISRQPTHSGRSGDVAAALEEIGRRAPGSRIAVVGFSLGGNVVLNLAGGQNGDTPANVERAMAVCPPIDLVACSARLRRGRARVYDRFFIRQLMAQLKKRRQTMPDAPTVEVRRKPTSLWEFDDVVTAPLCGFASAQAYYEATSPASRLADIGVPTLILAAGDDPLVTTEPFAKYPCSPIVATHIAQGGGHLGFIAARGSAPDRRWLDWRVVDWVMHEL